MLPQEEREMSQEELVKCFLDSNRELLAEFKESNSVLLQHLQVWQFTTPPSPPPPQ